MLELHTKYKMTYKGPFMITQCWTNSTVTLQRGMIKIKHNIRRIKPYTSDAKIEVINPKHMCDDVNI